MAGQSITHNRRAFAAGIVALTTFPAAAAKPLPQPKTANIHWPGPGHELHGYMAIPAKAHGPQPAVLVVHDAGGADGSTRGFADRVAEAGFIACVPTRLASLEEGVATVRWLASNAYATGKVAAIGIGWGGELVQRIAATPGAMLAGAVTFGASPLDHAVIPVLELDALGQLAARGGDAYDAAWHQTIAFLKEHLV